MNDTIQQAMSDIKSGMPIDQLTKYYPELDGNTQNTLVQYASDVKAGMPDTQASQYYPELFAPQTTDNQPSQNPLSKLFSAFGNLPVVKQASQIGGGIVGAAGGLIGGLTGGALETGRQLINAAQGKGFNGSQIIDSAVNLAKGEANFGNQIGQSGTSGGLLNIALGGLGTAGEAAGTALQVGQGVQGGQDIQSGFASNNPDKITQGALELGSAALMPNILPKGNKGNVEEPINPEANPELSPTNPPTSPPINPSTNPQAVDLMARIINSKMIPAVKDVAAQAMDSAGGAITPILESKLTNIAQDLVKMSPKQTSSEAQWGKNTPSFLVHENVLPEIKANGSNIDTTDAVLSLQQKYNAENQSFNAVLKDSGKYFSLEQFRQEALAKIDDSWKTKGSDYTKAKDYINGEIDALKNNYQSTGIQQGNDLLLPADEFNNIKSSFWQRSSVQRRVPGSELNADLNYQMGHTAKDMISSEIDDANINKMNSRLGDFAQAIKVLDNANGKKLPGGFIGKQFTRLAGTVIGATTGLPDAILGNITGGKLADLAADPQIRTGLLSKIYNHLSKTKDGYSVINEAKQILEQRGADRASRNLLQAPQSIQVGTPADTSKLFSQDEAQQLLDSYKIKVPPKLLQAPLGDKTNPIILDSPKK